LGHLKQLANPNEPEPQLRLEMERQLISRANRIIATTSDERQQIIRHCGATAGQIKVIPCGVDLVRFVPQNRRQAREKLELKQDTPVLLYVGRLDPFKGPDVLLQAAAMMQEDTQVLIVGGKLTGDKELEQLRDLARKLKINRRVHFMGARPQHELPAIYSAADVTVRRCPGFFAEKLDSLLQNPEVLAQMRAAARPSVLQYSWKHVASQMLDVYEDVISEVGCLVAQ
jgi:D-inositol-3-phosphate glycosyltransferase